MKEQLTAKVYAKSLVEVGKKVSADVITEMTRFNEWINDCNDLENILYLNVFTQDEKSAVVKDLFAKDGSFSPIFKNFVSYLIQEMRLDLLPLIYKELVVLDDHEKGFLRGTVEGVEETIEKEDLSKITSYLEEKLGLKVKLDYKPSTNLTAGNRVTAGDLQLDASVDKQLDLLKESILGDH